MNNEADWIIAIATTTAAIVSIVATITARKSASASQDSAKVAEKILRRSVIRELIAECILLIAEESRIQSLVTDLRFKSIGLYQGDPEELYKKDLIDTENKTKVAKSIIEKQEELLTASESDLDLKLTLIQRERAELQTIRENMLRSLHQSHDNQNK